MAIRGRPTKRSADVERRIIAGLSAGTPLTVICSPADMPADRTVRDWMDIDAEFSADIARARETGFDQIAMDALNIADTPVEGKRIKRSEDGTEEVIEDMLGHRKLQVETRLKLLAKWDPKRYGELIKHGNADGSNMDLAAAIMAGNARVADVE
jgi:hypothetical protein